MLGLTNVEWLVLFTAFLGCFGVCALIILTQRWHGAFTFDHDLDGIQKIHHAPVPRIGGMGLMAGLVTAVGGLYLMDQLESSHALILLCCAAPVFAIGILEDFTKQVSVRARLLTSFASAALACLSLDAPLHKLDTALVDQLMAWGPAAFIFTCFAVGGMTNATNIIDGLNGLASGATCIMLTGLAVIAHEVGDTMVVQLCLAGVAALGGFLLLNYPFGKIFLGDGGAYLAGFWLAECAVLLLSRNPEVSTWAVLLCVMYPAWETVYSMYRRRFKQRTRTGDPDSAHMHHVLLDAVRSYLGPRAKAWQQHGMTTALVWLPITVSQAIAWWVHTDHFAAMMASLTFIAVYVAVYRSEYLQASADDLAAEAAQEGELEAR